MTALSTRPTTATTRAAELCEWAAGLRLSDVPDRVVALATSQVISQLAAIRAGRCHPLGQALVRAFGSPWQADPGRSAGVLAGLGTWLNLDDTAFAGHLGGSAVAVPVAYAPVLNLDGAGLLTAVIAANECAARITAAATIGPFRGQSALHTHLSGAMAGRLACEQAPAGQWVDALGLAFAAPPLPLMRAFLGSQAKACHMLAPVRMAMDACDAASAGLSGPADVLEAPDGFLARFATVPLPELINAGLGERWHTDTLSFKVRPGGPGIDAAVDCAIELHRAAGGFAAEEVAEVVVRASRYTEFVGRKAAAYLAGPRTPISSLLLHTPYAVATALLTGQLTVADFTEPAVTDPARWALAARVRLEHDQDMTRALLGSVAPLGAALRQAGPRAQPWLTQFGWHEPVPRASDEFTEATKATPAAVTVHMADRRRFTHERVIPIGAIGPDTRRSHTELMRTKFLTHGGRPEVADALAQLSQCSARDVSELLPRALN